MNDKELENILNFVLNNMGDQSRSRITDLLETALLETAQIYYLKSEKLHAENAKLRSKIGLSLQIMRDNHWDLEESEIEYQVYKILEKSIDSPESL